MRVLLVKLSSLGDVIHNLPVVSDLARALPGIEIDWEIEQPYAEIAAMHPAIANTLPVPLRHLKKNPWSVSAWNGFFAARRRAKLRQYDAILDTQGLLKSALIARWSQGPVSGYAGGSAREPLAAKLYDHRFDIPRDLHAVERNRQLAARAFGYELSMPLSYGLNTPTTMPGWLPVGPYCVFLHATSRVDKMWPDTHWATLGQKLNERGTKVLLPWGSEREHETSKRLSGQIASSVVPPRMTLTDAAAMLAGATGVVGVDTGLAHLSVALARPTIGLYIATEPKQTGLYGGHDAVNLGGGSPRAPTGPDVESVWQLARSWYVRPT